MDVTNTTSDETGPRQPRKEKRMALLGALWGAIGGGIVIGVVFFLAAVIMNLEYRGLIVFVGIALGIATGAGAGPLAALRFSRGFGSKHGDLSQKPL